MPPLYYVIINKDTAEQYRNGLHAVTFDTASEGDEVLSLLHTEFGEQYAGWVVMSNIDAMALLEERLKKYFPTRCDFVLPFSQRWITMVSPTNEREIKCTK